jgi:uncharacterized membrane protein
MLASFMPDPLHAALVHMPVAFAVLAPVAAAGALLLVSRGADVPRSWGMVVVLLALLSMSAVVAKSTGEDQEDRVEEVVPHAAIETHEEAADVFTIGSFILLAVAAVGLVRGQVGRWARLTATLGTLALLWAGYAVGHSGGRLVYQHGAAAVYRDSTQSGAAPPTGESARDR